MQAAADVQDTPDKVLWLAPVGLGVGWIVQPDANAVEAPASQTERVTAPATTKATREPRAKRTIHDPLRPHAPHNVPMEGLSHAPNNPRSDNAAALATAEGATNFVRFCIELLSFLCGWRSESCEFAVAVGT